MTSDNYANPDILVDGQWLENHIDDPNVRIVDCDMFDSYQRAHIRGAVGIKVHHYIKHPKYSENSTEYPWVAEPEVVKELFEEMGIGDETIVVSYDSNGSLWAARFWWVLNYYGHTNAKVLNGGWKKWFAEGHHKREGEHHCFFQVYDINQLDLFSLPLNLVPFLMQ